jgi:hypothetical protein
MAATDPGLRSHEVSKMAEPTDDGVDEDDDAPVIESGIPDESTLLGASGIEQEVLAEAARAEGELADPSHDDGEEDDGSQV